MRRTSYTMDGFCPLYLLLILLIRSGDVETNPGPNPAVSNVSDMEFLKLALDIAPSYYKAVGISLGIPHSQLQAILVENCINYTNALLDVFMKWNVMRQPPHSNKRQLLADKLQDIDLGGLSDRILNEPLIPNSTEPLQGASSSQPQQTSHRSTEETQEIDSGRQEDFDEKLTFVARKVYKHEDLDCLGKALGFEPEDIECYVNTNMKNAHISYMGTLSMLRDWRKKQTEATECEALKDALTKACQINLTEMLFEPLQSASSSQPQQTSYCSTEETLENISGRQEDFDEKLRTVAQSVFQREDLFHLGIALGFQLEDIHRYVATNFRNSSYMGTLSMLRKWRKEQTEATECEAMKIALREARQLRLAHELFGTS